MGGAFTTTDGCMKHIDGGAKKVIISAPAKDAMDHPEFVIKHINSPMSPEYMKYLLEHDTVHGRFDGTVEVTDKGLMVNGLPITLSATRDPTEIPWGKVGVDYVCESTGAFTTTEGCLKHVDAGAKKVIIS